jgi:hypothetical protein
VGFNTGGLSELEVEKRCKRYDYEKEEYQEYDKDICSSLHVSSCFLDYY